MTTGMNLKVARITARLTQAQVAERAGLSRSWVAKAEGFRGEVPADMISKYDEALRTFGVVRQQEPDR
jgi:transcriptional regulator with XRE-family HTH domain